MMFSYVYNSPSKISKSLEGRESYKTSTDRNEVEENRAPLWAHRAGRTGKKAREYVKYVQIVLHDHIHSCSIG